MELLDNFRVFVLFNLRYLWHTKDKRMIPFILVRKILLSLAPLVIFYLLRKMSKNKPKRKSYLSDFDRDKIIDGEIVEEKK